MTKNNVILNVVKNLKQYQMRGDVVSTNTYYVYMMTNWNNKVLYVGVTNNLERRVYEHKNKLTGGFTARYNVNKLVYYDETSDVEATIEFEKKLKGWRREKKNELINSVNPEWKDLSLDW